MYVTPKGLLQCKCCQRLGHTQQNCGYTPRCVVCGGFHLSGGCCTLREQPQCCGCGGNHTANYCGCVEWKKARAALAKQASEPGPKSAALGQTAAPKCQRAGPSRADGPGRGVESLSPRECVVKATTTPPNPIPQTVTVAPKKPTVTATSKTTRPKKPESKAAADPKPATVKPKKKAAASAQSAAAKPSKPKLVVPTQSPASPLEKI
jgi:hypothetical protein